MKHLQSVLLWCMLAVGVLINTAVLVQLQRSHMHSQHQLQLQVSSRPGEADLPGAPLPDQALTGPVVRISMHKIPSVSAQGSSVDAPVTVPRDDFRLDFGLWLSYAAADAAQEGTEVPISCQKSHGAAFIERFRASCGQLCGPGPAMPAQGGHQQQQRQETPMSQVDCCAYPVDGGKPCRSSNIVVNTTAFMGDSPAEGEPSHAGYLPKGTPGSVQLQCQMPHLTPPIAAAEAGTSDSAAAPAAAAATAAAARSAAYMEQQLHNEGLPWFKSALQHVEPAVVQESCSSGDDVISHPVMFVTRLDPTNPYHHTQSIIQAFLTLGVFNSSRNLPGLQVILADHFIPGPFLGIWQRLADPYPVLTMDHPALAGRRLCFTNSIHAHYVGPGRAFLGYEGVGSAKPCPSTLLMAASHWARYLFREILPAAEQQQYDAQHMRGTIDAWTRNQLPSQLPQPVGTEKGIERSSGSNDSSSSSSTSTGSSGDESGDSRPMSVVRHLLAKAPASVRMTKNPSHTSNDHTPHTGTGAQQQQQQQHRRLNVVWLSRSWFGRAMKAGGGLTGWQASRDMSHEAEDAIVKALELAVMDWNDAACAPPAFGWWQKARRVEQAKGCKPTNVSFNFRSVELSVEELQPDQVVLLTRTAVLVGIHGAALTNMMWMRPHRGAVVEFGAGGNFHYVNMAAELGHRHLRLEGGPDVGPLIDAVKKALDHVSSRY